jgi:Acetyltransferase (GNAT) domain
LKTVDRKKQYHQFCLDNSEINSESSNVCVFGQAWFLDAVCGAENWGACVDITQNGQINGVLPYFITKKWGFKIITQPTLTGYMGLWIRYETQWNAHQKNSQERVVLKKLIAQLPSVYFFSQAYPPFFQNWLPFQWVGFGITVRMTHLLLSIQDIDRVYLDFKDSVRRKIKKAALTINVEITDDVALVYNIYAEIMRIKGRGMSYNQAFLANIHTKIKDNHAGQLYKAVDTEGVVHAAIYIIWDRETAYYWLGGSSVAHRESGALTLLVWEIMKDLGKRGIQNFDFTGSDLENLESFFSAFNTEKRTYFKVSRYGNRLLKIIDKIMR